MATPVYIVAGQSNAYSLNGGNGGASLAQAYANLTGSGNVRVEQVGTAGAPLTWGRDGDDWYHTEELFDQMVATIKQALSEPGTYLASIVWIQGEGDTWGFARASEYAARLTALVHRLEDRLALLPEQTADFRFSVLSLSANCPARADHANWDTVRKQQLSLNDPRIDVVDIDRATAGQTGGASLFQADGLHYAAIANDPALKALLDRSPLHLLGTMGADALRGLSGHDTLRGGAGNDQLVGNTGNDSLRAWTGNDALYGGAGNDSLTGDQGTDQLYGGAGADHFVFIGGADSRPGTSDTIHDFAHGSDKIALTTIDANSLVTGNQAFRYLGTAGFDGHAAALRLQTTSGGTWMHLDLNGDRAADVSVFLAGASGLTASDFLL